VDISALLPVTNGDRTAAFVDVAGAAPLIRVVRVMLHAVPEPACAVVAASAPLAEEVRKVLAASGHSAVTVIAADDGTGSGCLAAALNHTGGSDHSAAAVLVHDIARPLVSPAVQDRVMAAMYAGADVAVPTRPVTDSVKAVDDRGSVSATLDRSRLHDVQYPRGFRVGHLSALLAQQPFDELEAALSAGLPVTIVEGDADGFRVELPRDSDYVEALIASPRAR
jgi:2-C-methyl-D-erythritol 4-phosphate cytidylyltransferase